MIKKMNIKLVISLFLFWGLLTFNFEVYNLALGLIISLLISVFFAFFIHREERLYNVYWLDFLKFLLLVVCNIYKAAFLYTKKIVKNKGKAHVVNIDLGIKHELVAVLIANAITLTPGTITLKIYGNNYLKVLIQLEDMSEIEDFREEIEMYRRILESR